MRPSEVECLRFLGRRRRRLAPLSQPRVSCLSTHRGLFGQKLHRAGRVSVAGDTLPMAAAPGERTDDPWLGQAPQAGAKDRYRLGPVPESCQERKCPSWGETPGRALAWPLVFLLFCPGPPPPGSPACQLSKTLNAASAISSKWACLSAR